MSTFLVVDTANTFSRASYVAHGSSPEERGAMALHIMLMGLTKARRTFGCDHVVFCMEGRSWRRTHDTKYKANRDQAKAAMTQKEVDEQQAMYDALNNLAAFIDEKTNCTVLQHKQCEADDFIARWIQLHPNDTHYILSSDSDFRQLIADNVSIYDVPGQRMFCTSNTALISKIKNDREIKKVVEEDPEYYLFKKIIRGDSSDHIFSAYPKVREKGTKNKVGIIQAYEDRHAQGYNWTNFMSQTWKEPILNEDFDPYTDSEDKRYTYIEHVVKDRFEHNKRLIDLSAQPQEIIDAMDAVIMEKVQTPVKAKVGFHFAKFCNQYDLVRVSEQLTDFADLFNARYSDA